MRTSVGVVAEGGARLQRRNLLLQLSVCRVAALDRRPRGADSRHQVHGGRRRAGRNGRGAAAEVGAAARAVAVVGVGHVLRACVAAGVMLLCASAIWNDTGQA